MSIHKPTLYKMLEDFILLHYKGSDINTLLYLVKTIVLNHPERNCIKKSEDHMWNGLPKNKSLFTCGDDYGMPIGNLTSQCFANFYLSEFDKIMKQKFVYYGRYVDDFYIINKKKDDITKFVPEINRFLYINLLVKLHSKKRYIQHYSKGVKFVGAVVKKDRMYIANSTVSNIYKTIHRFNLSSELNYESFVNSLNSYYGFLKHYLAYHIKRRIYKEIDPKWYLFFQIVCTYNKFMVHIEYKREEIIKHTILNILNYDTRRK